MQDKCGVFAAFTTDRDSDVSDIIIDGLHMLQHRGQLSAGVTLVDSNGELSTHKGMGLVREIFDPRQLIRAGVKSNVGIGHVRYATAGSASLDEAQPCEVDGDERIAFAYNGHIANYKDLIRRFAFDGLTAFRDLDTEVIREYVRQAINNGGSINDIPLLLEDNLDGAYSFVAVDENGNGIAYRDHRGFKPLCYAQVGNTLLVASESVALKEHATDIYDLEPGQMLSWDNRSGLISIKSITPANPSHCFFEYVYFSSPESNLNGSPINNARFNSGIELANLEDQIMDENCVAMAVPDTALASCQGYTMQSGINMTAGIIRNGGPKRTFIEDSDRKAKVKKKLKLQSEKFEGKRVFIVDDSLVRSNTIRALLEEIRDKCNPSEIHLRLACPPILSECFYGIDMASKGELFASQYSEPLIDGKLPDHVLDLMAQELGVDSIRFLPIDNLADSICINTGNLCKACVSGQYPTAAGQRLAAKLGIRRRSEKDPITASALEKSCS